jgi:hypothetical protein
VVRTTPPLMRVIVAFCRPIVAAASSVGPSACLRASSGTSQSHTLNTTSSTASIAIGSANVASQRRARATSSRSPASSAPNVNVVTSANR